MSEKDTLNKLKEQEREARKNLIIDAAVRVFSSQPFDKVSMREIAQDAGIATSSIYTYFPNQESLFLETLMRDTTILIEKLNSIIEKTDKELLVDTMVEAFIDYISQYESYFRMMILFMAQGNLSEESVEKLNEIMRRALDSFETVFKSINYNGDSRILSHLFFATMNGIVVSYRRLPGRSEKEIIEHMKSIGKILGNMIKSNSIIND